MTMIHVACGIMYMPDHTILMGLRSKSGPNPYYWEFPGGQLEDDETLEECLQREWIEELNLQVSIDRFLYTTIHKDISCHFFVGKIQDIEKTCELMFMNILVFTPKPSFINYVCLKGMIKLLIY